MDAISRIQTRVASWGHEAKLTTRSLTRSRAYTAAVILALAIGILELGLVGSVVVDVLLEPLPFREASRLVSLAEDNKGALRLASYAVFRDLQARSTSIANMAYVRGNGTDIETPSGEERATIAYVTPGYLHILGAQPLLGRWFSADEERLGAPGVVVLSQSLWQQAFGGDSTVLGRTIRLDSTVATVVGVMPDAAYPQWANLWRPIATIANTDIGLRSRNLHSDGRIIARLRPHVSLELATRALSGIQRQLASDTPDMAGWDRIALTPLRDEMVGTIEPVLRILAVGAVLIWLLICVNVASLALARSLSRQREAAIRQALGQSRSRAFTTSVFETVCLAMVGGLLALIAWAWALQALRMNASRLLPRVSELHADARLGAGIVVLAIASGLLCALPVAARHLARQPFDALRGGGATRRGGHFRALLNGAQAALAMTLLVSASLLVGTMRRLVNANFGFDPHGVLTFYLFPTRHLSGPPEHAAELYASLLDEIRAIPGIESAAIVNTPPLTGGGALTHVNPQATANQPSGSAVYLTVSADYFRTMRISALRGRLLDKTDIEGPTTNVVVSESFVKEYCGGHDPIGMNITLSRASQLRAGFGSPLPSTIVGVVRDVKHFDVTETQMPEVYVPYTREVWPGVAVLVRTAGDPMRFVPALKRAILSVVPDAPVADASGHFGFRTITSYVSDALSPKRYLAMLLTLFAGSAIILAALGVYGTTAYNANQRTNEVGIRMALGATNTNVLEVMMSRSLVALVPGLIAGGPVAAGASWIERAVLYDISPVDPPVYVWCAIVVALSSVLAAAVPVWRLTRINPSIALRIDAS